MIQRFVKRPVIIEAMQVTDTHSAREACEWINRNGGSAGEWVTSPNVYIETLEGTMTAREGDWVIKGVKGEFYPCKPDIFEATYEPAVAIPRALEGKETPEEGIKEGWGIYRPGDRTRHFYSEGRSLCRRVGFYAAHLFVDTGATTPGEGGCKACFKRLRKRRFGV